MSEAEKKLVFQTKVVVIGLFASITTFCFIHELLGLVIGLACVYLAAKTGWVERFFRSSSGGTAK